MIGDSVGIVAILLAIEGGVLVLSEHPRTKRLFKFLPAMFWIYFLPMLANTFGLLPPEKDAGGTTVTPVYGAVTTYFLPAALILLLVSADIKAILRLGKTALIVMLAGSAGILLMAPLVLLVFRPLMPAPFAAEAWKGFGALSASWIGGSANMFGVAQGLGAPDSVYLPMVIVDTIDSYTWMGILIFVSAWQAGYDRWNRSRTGVLEELKSQSLAMEQKAHPMTLAHFTAMAAVAAVGTYAAWWIGRRLPEWPQLVNSTAWTIILASTLGIVLSFTPLRRLEAFGASRLGYAALYFVLASIGAKANFSHLLSAPVLVAAGLVWILLHGAILVLVGRLVRAPMALIATASQANIGGPASAPVVAGVYQPGLAPVGLLMAVLGNILGTYLGFVSGHLCRWVSGGG